MKKWMTFLCPFCLAASLTVPAFALDYNVAAPGDPEYAKACSIEVIYTADGGARQNTDISKNAALIPPAFGSPSADAPNTGEYLTPNIAPKGSCRTGNEINSSIMQVARISIPTFTMTDEPIVNSAPSSIPSGSVTVTGTRPYTTASASGYTDVTRELYYSGGYLATLKIPAIGVNVKVYQGTDSNTLAKGAGHFEETSIWNGRVAIAGHNRGTNCVFGEIHTLAIGDRITLTTKLGTRTYAVDNVSKVRETDRSELRETADNTLALYTCVRDQSGYRWCVTASQIR